MGQVLVNGIEDHRTLPSGERSEVFFGVRRVLGSVRQTSKTSVMCAPRESPAEKRLASRAAASDL